MEKGAEKRVVITGAGVLTAFGDDLREYCRALQDGKVALRATRYEAPGGETTRMVAAITAVPRAAYIAETESRFFSLLSRAATYCSEIAVKSAELDPKSVDPARAGVLFGSGFVNLYDLAPVYETFFTGDERRLSPLVIPINMASCPTGRLSMRYGFRGTTRSVSTACASSSTALADAWRLIRDGSHDVVLAGGADLVCCTTLVRSWERLRILCPPTEDPVVACRPFDRDRNGLALGDAAAIFVLEERERALARGAVILAELRGAFENADAYDMLKPSAAGEALCMRGAIDAAGLSPDEIDVIQAHGTATALNDTTEYAALQQVFGERASNIPLSAIKSMIGHTMGASGAMAVAATLGSFEHGYLYPVPGFRQADDDVRVNISAVGRVADDVRHVLINAFGFGGSNACLVVSKHDDGGMS